MAVDYENFCNILTNVLGADNDLRTKSEAIYDAIPIDQKISMLISVFGNEASPAQEAELAAVLLRRSFAVEYEQINKLNIEIQFQIRNQLLHIIQHGTNSNLKRKICDAAAELARSCIDDEGNNLWPEFLKFLFDSACSGDTVMKELSLIMFSAVPGVFGNLQNKYIDVIRQMLTESLSHQDKKVKFAAVKATVSFLLAHEKEVLVLKQFSPCVALLLQFFSCTLEEEEVEEALRQLVDLAETCPQVFRGDLDFLLTLCLKGLAGTYTETCRNLCLETMVTLAESAPAMMRKLGTKHIPILISLIFKMMADLTDEQEWDFIDDEDEIDDSDSDPLVAEAALDRIACGLGGKTVLPIVLSALPKMLQSPNWKERYAGLMTISAVGEGCHKQMSVLLPQIVEGVLPFVMDSHSRVRYAVCNALGQMSTDFSPIFQKKFHEKVINGLLQLLSDPQSPRVQAHAGAALVNFFEECPKNILSPYMDILIERFEFVLKSKLEESVEKGTKLVLEQVVVTLASLADCAEEKFINYYDKFMPCLKYIIQHATQPNMRVLRGKAIECVSLIGLAVGKEKFLADASEVMELLLKTQTLSTMEDDDPQLSYMIASWARICRILGKAFEPYLPHVMQPVLKTAAIKPEVALLDSDDMKVIESNPDDWEFVNLGEKHNFGIKTAGLEEKATACQMLVCYARELKDGFAAYVEDTVKLMVPMLKFYFHHGVRLAACEIMPCLLESAKVRGETYVKEMWKYILPALIQAIEAEPDTEVLCQQMEAFALCVEVLQYPCLDHDELLTLINLLDKHLLGHFDRALAREGKRGEEDYDDVLEETLEKEDDDDVYLLGKIADIVCILISTYKQDFFQYFDMLLPHFIKLVSSTKSGADRQWALCVFSDIIEHGGPACSKYQQYFLQPILDSLKNKNADLRQTAAYTLGVLAQFGGPEFAKYCSDSLPLLVQIINDPLSRTEENERATENAISAVTKLLVSNNSMVNMNELIPMWMSWLPISEDEEECKYVFGFLCSLLETNNPLLLGNDNCNLPRIVQIIAEAFHKEAIEINSDVGKRLLLLIKDIQKNSQLFSLCVGHLNPQQQKALHSSLTAAATTWDA